MRFPSGGAVSLPQIPGGSANFANFRIFRNVLLLSKPGHLISLESEDKDESIGGDQYVPDSGNASFWHFCSGTG